MEYASVSGSHIRKSIQTNIHFFCSNTVNPQVLLIHLLSTRVISQEECHQIEKLRSNFDRNCKLYLLILEKLSNDRDRNSRRDRDRDRDRDRARGSEKISQLLIKALNESGNELIVHTLKSTEFKSAESEPGPGFADENLILQNRVENGGRITQEKDSNNNTEAPNEIRIKSKVSKVRFHSVDVDLLHSNNNVLSPIKFSFVHGANIHVFQRGEVAKRVRDFCNGIVFTDRPVAINERVCVKLAEISKDWSGFFRFGFTNQDPNSLRNSLPLYLLPQPGPDTSAKPSFHFWAKAFSDFKHPVAKNSVLTFLLKPNGDVIFSVNGFEKGMFFTGVETKWNLPLWAVFDIYGNTTALELINER